MTIADVQKLVAVAPESVVLHLPSAEGNEHIPVDDAYLSILDSLLSSGLVHHCHCHGTAVHPLIGTVVEQGLLGPRVRTKTGKVKVECYAPDTRAGSVQIPGAAVERKKGRLRCLRPWDHLLLPNGDVIVCSLDCGLKNIIGNLSDQDYESLFSSEAYLLIGRAGGQSLDILCRRLRWRSAVFAGSASGFPKFRVRDSERPICPSRDLPARSGTERRPARRRQ
jgi:hypothetical protein